ncbi:MAG: CpaF family protein [Gemmatimonadetes bacterium]|nr:CpaF family protein [Gemmatimonadota bacterium]
MKRASGVGHLAPFLPGLRTLLEDPEVSEIMINGPANVWVERGGRLEPHEARELTAAWLHRAAIHIARPLGLDPAARPILDARLEDGSRVAICTPPASPEVAITIRRFGGRAFTADDLVRLGSLPEDILEAARSTLASRQNILVSGGTGSGKTTLLNALIESGSSPSRTRSNSGSTGRTASGSRPGPPSPRRRSRSGTWCATRSATGPTTSSSARSGAARPPTCCRRSTPDTAGRSPPSTPTTRAPRSRGSRAAPCRPETRCLGR